MNPPPIGERRCLYCNSIIYSGRTDKHHCSARCRSKLHYQKNKASIAYQRNLAARLKNGERSLARIGAHNGIEEVPASAFSYERFDFTAFSSATFDEKRKLTVYWLLQTGWSKNRNGTYNIHYRTREGHILF